MTCIFSYIQTEMKRQIFHHDNDYLFNMILLTLLGETFKITFVNIENTFDCFPSEEGVSHFSDMHYLFLLENVAF